ncbi:MAG: 4'-phosphopantetheinyl transferase superfamily protein [Methylococcaceae bacterium]|nr:4'-phosphopantetheinyl transferase superfamily protein [Methylococcaceae bacterium]
MLNQQVLAGKTTETAANMTSWRENPAGFISALDERLAQDEAHVYTLNLAAFREDDIHRYWLLLDEEEQARARRFRHEPSRNCFVLVRAALRRLLGWYLQREPTTLEFAIGEKGKPRLAENEPNRGLVFNVSHSGDHAIFALARDTPIGVDVEYRRAMSDMDGMATHCFAAHELNYWRALPEERRESAFFAFWTCKEAFLKATGEGISLGLKRCIVELEPYSRLISIPETCGTANEWRLIDLESGAGISSTLCYRGAERSLRRADAGLFLTGS